VLSEIEFAKPREERKKKKEKRKRPTIQYLACANKIIIKLYPYPIECHLIFLPAGQIKLCFIFKKLFTLFKKAVHGRLISLFISCHHLAWVK
jgi:hypothetical protein